MGTIYKITNKTNQKIYVGQTINTVEYRFKQHWREAESEKRLNKTSSYFHNALLKYGKESFELEILEVVDNTELSTRERHWIQSLQATDRTIGYNIGEGGETAVRSPEVRKKIGLKTKQRWENDPEAASRMRAGLAKATKTWQEQSKAKRTVKVCLVCRTEFEVANWNSEQKYCSRECSQSDASNWVNYQAGLDAAVKQNIINGEKRSAKIKETVLLWTLVNSKHVLSIPYNKIAPNLQPLIELVKKEVGVSDTRTIAKAVCGQSGKKALLDYLKNYVKMYAVPDQK